MPGSGISSVRVVPVREDSHSLLPEEKVDPSDSSASRAPVASMAANVPGSNGNKDLESNGADRIVVIPEITIKDAFLVNTAKFHKILIRVSWMLCFALLRVAVWVVIPIKP